MYPLIFAKGTAVSSTGVGGAAAGSRTFEVADASGFAAGVPTFLVGAAAGEVSALGRLGAVTGNQVETPWALAQAPAGSWSLEQPEAWLIVPPHALPLLHREYRLGLEDVPTEGGAHRATATREPEEIVRLRIQAPGARMLEELLDWGPKLAAAASLDFSFVDFSRRVCRVALAGESIDIRPELHRPGEPFDLLLRLVAPDEMI